MAWMSAVRCLPSAFVISHSQSRGYGRSSKPPGDPAHAAYSKRAMAADMVRVMERLGHTRFRVGAHDRGAHDRGARAAHRVALDWPGRVARLALLDIAPTREMYRETTDRFARDYWHWFFMIQKPPLPERMMAADPEAFWLWKCGGGSAGLTPFTEAALEDYLTAFRDPRTIEASCEDYRAAATIDIRHDDEDRGRKVDCPLLALWGAEGAVARNFDVLALWREWARRVTGGPLPGGHYLAEECPDEVYAAFFEFSRQTD